MKKILMTLAALGCLTTMSTYADSYLYWMTDLSTSTSGYAQMSEFTFAKLVDATDQTVYDIAAIKGSDGINTAVIGSAVTDYTSHSYYVELWNDTMSWKMGTSETLGANALAAFVYDHTQPGGIGTPGAKFGSFTYNAPEPTSGLLILFGVCGLALKRKRA